MDIDKWFAKRIRTLRKKEGMSQAEFAELCNIGKATYERLERGEFLPRMSTCLLISRAFNISFSELFKGLEEEL